MRRCYVPNNVVIAPASLLPFNPVWQRLANALPPGTLLLVVPTGDTPLNHRLGNVAHLLRPFNLGPRCRQDRGRSEAARGGP
ncbi:MAG: hypothetical protein M3R02_19705 [Chloroflexota bacterium]|nr:hypothetical protein [Chloroflexota bacterium]